MKIAVMLAGNMGQGAKNVLEASLSKPTLKAVGLKPLLQGVILWLVISIASLSYILIIA